MSIFTAKKENCLVFPSSIYAGLILIDNAVVKEYNSTLLNFDPSIDDRITFYGIDSCAGWQHASLFLYDYGLITEVLVSEYHD